MQRSPISCAFCPNYLAKSPLEKSESEEEDGPRTSSSLSSIERPPREDIRVLSPPFDCLAAHHIAPPPVPPLTTAIGHPNLRLFSRKTPSGLEIQDSVFTKLPRPSVVPTCSPWLQPTAASCQTLLWKVRHPFQHVLQGPSFPITSERSIERTLPRREVKKHQHLAWHVLPP